MMHRLVLQKSVTVTGVCKSRHISPISLGRVWISDGNNLILTNTAGDELDNVTDIKQYSYGGHTVNNDGDLIYIDNHGNINKLSTYNKIKTTLIKCRAPRVLWIPQCIFSSPSTGDLLVGMLNTGTVTGKVVRYNSTGEIIQSIQYDNTGCELYSRPIYITENRNGDVIVSDIGCVVVVTDCDGKHRFSDRSLFPLGICTDALSHILVCDYNTKSVQMLDRNGHFLSQIQISQHGIDYPLGLSYDDNTQLLWIGSYDSNIVNIYIVLHRNSLTGLPLEDFKCKNHPEDPLTQFCIPCEVALCQICINTSDNHKKHDVRDVETLFEEIHKRKDGDAVLMCLLLCPSYKINLKEEHWIKKYNAVAEVFKFKEIKKPSNLGNLKKYKPVVTPHSGEIEFSCEFFRHTSFLRFAKNPDFVDIFLSLAEKDNIAEYCRSWGYQTKEEEVFCWLSPQQTEQLIGKLGDDIFQHTTWQDTTIHEAVFNNLGVPMPVLMRGEESAKNFIENLKKGETTMYHASGMIIGCAGSGKSTLLKRLKGIDLNEILKNSTSTRGIEVQSDIFDVTNNTITVNMSTEKQRFKVKIDESNPEQLAELSGDTKKLDIEEIGYQKDTRSKASDEESESDVEMPRGNLDTESDSRKGNEAAAFVDNEEMVKNKQNVPDNSEISGILRVSKNVSDDVEKKLPWLTLRDSVHIMPHTRYFLVLVLSSFWCLIWRRSLMIWLEKKSVARKVPFTKDGRIEEKEKFFREVWTALETENDTLQKHIDRKRMFAVGFHENECVEKIKLSIVDVVQKLDHWGEKLPYSWALFENFFQEKKNLKIISKETLLAFNEALPKDLKLEKVEDINTLLQFFHDIRELLHFDQESLRGIIILDVQWFADAFKNVITDKNHAAEDLFKLASQWDKFNETGVLSDTLLSAIWDMNNNGYLEHKEDIMRYMEKLGLLAKMEYNNWYVPCMNKRPFPTESFSSYPASSILCYTFDVLPAGIFYRLVATCIQIPWELFTDRDRGCIYQTAAVFQFQDQHHIIMLGMTQTDIQLQVFVLEGEVDVLVCHQIRGRIESILQNLSNTFMRNTKFHVAFKCKPLGFCDSKESAVIGESKLTRATFNCPFCPVTEKHVIKSSDITKYWIKMQPSNPNTVTASAQSLGERSRFAKLGMATNDVLNQAYRDILDMEVPPSLIYNKVKASPNIHKRLRPEQEQILINANRSGYKYFDISLTYTLIRNICKKIPLPTKGKWGDEPAAGEETVGDDIERIRSIRNGLTAHVSSASTPQKEFDDTWSVMSDICQRLETFTGKNYLDSLKKNHNLTLKEEDAIDMEILRSLVSDVQKIKRTLKIKS